MIFHFIFIDMFNRFAAAVRNINCISIGYIVVTVTVTYLFPLLHFLAWFPASCAYIHDYSFSTYLLTSATCKNPVGVGSGGGGFWT